MANPLAFKPDEDAVIRDLYPDFARMLERLPNRSRFAIKKRASKLGVSAYRSTSLRKWTAEEDSIIRELHPDYDAIAKRLPHRSRISLKNHASVIKAAKPKSRHWTAEERALVLVWGAVVPGRSRNAILKYRERNGIRVGGQGRPSGRPAVRAAKPGAVTFPKVIRASAPQPVAWKRQGNEISPRVIAAAARSRHGIELIATVQRAVPRDVWPHLRPLVIEQVALGVMERRIDLSDLAGAVKTTAAALVAQQFSGAA